MKAIALVGLIGAATLSVGPVLAATIEQFTSKEGHEVVTLAGEIVRGDTERLVATVKVANDAGRVVSGIRLNSPGGTLIEGVRLAEAIRDAKLATMVTSGTMCASACFVAFAAGGEKFASYNAQVGVHGASTGGIDDNDAKAATIMMAKIIKELGVSDGIIGKMVVTAPDQIVWLSPSDLQSMGVTMTPSTQAKPEAFSYPTGLNPDGDNWLALRSKPSATEGTRLAKLRPETLFSEIDRAGDWVYVRLPDGVSGWVSARYVGCCRAASIANSEPSSSSSTASCDDLWYRRNALYKAAGYCFRAARGINTFGNAGCRYNDEADVPLAGQQRMEVAALKREEIDRGCSH